MDKETAEKVFQFVKKRSELFSDSEVQVDIHGGEPLLNYNILKYLVQAFRAWKRDVHIDMTTNATLLDDEKLKFISEKFNEISISLDGIPEIHDRNRVTLDGEGTFQAASKYIDDLQKNMTAIIARMTVTHETVSALYDGVAYLYNRGFHVISPVIDQCDQQWDEKTLEELKHQLIRLSESFSGHEDLKIGLLEKSKHRKKSRCLSGDMTMHIDTRGVIYPCAYVVGNSKFEMGSVATGIEERKLEKIREINQYKFEQCASCGWKEYCCGYRCKLINYAISGEFEPLYTTCRLEHILLEVYRYGQEHFV